MRSLLLTSGLAFLLLTLNPCVAAGQKPLRVLVDASKDGGLWWFPQGRGNTFDPKEKHPPLQRHPSNPLLLNFQKLR